ncbi:MAG TPA: choice-of-anchor D domain-containing protein [Terriglobia bacterium]|nr:choice-of-anchor D domain-containing protein [Terriglobia bacterium]
MAWCQATVNESLETAFIYVDATNGSDSNPGTATLPLQTIGAAVSLAETNNVSDIGSRVIINPGVYREAVSIEPPHNGTTMPITFEAAVNGTAFVSGAQQYAGWQVDSGNNNIYTDKWTYAWGVCNTLVPGSPPAPDIALRREMVFVNGTPLTQVLSFNEMMVGTFYVDESGGTIYMWPPAGTKVSTADVEVSVLPTVWNIQGQSNIVVRGLTFQYANSCRENAAVTVYGPTQPISNILLDTDSFVWNNAQGLSLSATLSYYTVQNSVADHNGEAGFQATQIKYGLYQNDQVNYNNWRGAQGSYYTWNDAGAHFYNMHDLTVNNLEVAYNETYGVHFDTDNDTITVTSMTAYGNALSSAFTEVSGGPITFSNSTFCGTAPLNTAAQQIGFALSDSLDVTVTKSNFVNNNIGLQVEGVEGGLTITNWETGQQYQALNENFTFTNNIVEGGGGQDVFLDSLADPDWSGWVSTLNSNVNTWWNATASADFMVPVPNLDTLDDFPTWQQTTGQDSGSVWAVPAGNPGAACSGLPDMPDFWFLVPPKISPLISGNQTPAVFTATMVPLNFTGTAQLSYDGVQNIPGATANWSSNTLAPNQSANFTVTPSSTTAAGTYPITLISTSGNITRTNTVLLTIDTAVQLSPTSLSFGNQLIKTSSSPQTVKLMNTSSSIPLSGISISITGPNAFTQTNNCPATLAVKSSCTITVTFTPVYAGSLAATISIADSDGTSPQEVALSGTGTQPVATLTPSTLGFGNVVVGTTSPAQTLTLSNSGTASLSITSITITQSTTFAETNTCGSTLAAGNSCKINVTFTPTGTWTSSGTLTVNDNASPSFQQASLSGTGIQSAVLLSTKSLNFGNQVWQATSATKTVTVTNSGTANLTITSIAVTGSNAADFAETNTCGNSLAPNASCSINATFTPKALGARSAAVTLTDNAANSPQTVNLNGTGTTSVSFTPKNLNFGNHKVGQSSNPIGVTVTNLGTTKALTVNGITFTGANLADFSQTNNCGASLGAGKNCTINVTFTPAKTGTRSATLNINDNDPASPQQVTLTGDGT